MWYRNSPRFTYSSSYSHVFEFTIPKLCSKKPSKSTSKMTFHTIQHYGGTWSKDRGKTVIPKVLESHTLKHNLWVLDKIAVANFTFMIQNHLTFSKRHILCFRKTGFYSAQIQVSALTMNIKEHWDGSGGRERESTSSHPTGSHVPSQLLQTHFIINL